MGGRWGCGLERFFKKKLRGPVPVLRDAAPMRLAARPDDLAHDHVAFQPRQMADEQVAVEMVDLVLEADRHQPVEIAFPRLPCSSIQRARTTSGRSISAYWLRIEKQPWL